MQNSASVNTIRRLLKLLLVLSPVLSLFYSYTLFHSIVGMASVLIALIIFVLIWNMRRYIADEGFFIVLGISSFFTGILDFLHMLFSENAGLFHVSDENLSTQFWIAARLLQSLFLLYGVSRMKSKVNPVLAFLSCLAVALVEVALIFPLKLFPPCYDRGTGFTVFKMSVELACCAVYLSVLVLLFLRRGSMSRVLSGNLLWAIGLLMASECFFTFAGDSFSAFSLIGHVLKLLFVYFLYESVVAIGLRQPYQLLFHDLEQSRDKLQAERDVLRQYLDISSGIIVILDKNREVTQVNKRGCEILGCDEELILGKKWCDGIVYGEAGNRFRQSLDEAIIGHTAALSEFEATIESKGGMKNVAWRVSPLRGPSSEVLGVLCSGEDITEKLRSEREIKHLASFPQMNPNPISEIDLDGQISYLNPAFISLFPDIRTKGLDHPWFSGFDAIREGFKATPTDHSVRRTLAIGDRFFRQSIYFHPSHKTIRAYGVDISERERIESMLRQAQAELEVKVEQRTAELNATNRELEKRMHELKVSEKELKRRTDSLEAFFKHSLTSLVFLDPQFNFIRVNEAYARSCRIPIEEFAGKNHFQLFPSEDLQRDFRKVVETKKPYQVFSRPFVFSDHPEWGTTFWDLTLNPILDEEGKVEFLIFALNDVTERKRAEESLRNNERLLREVLANLPIGVWIIDARHEISHWNPVGKKIWRGRPQTASADNEGFESWWLDEGLRIFTEELGLNRVFTDGSTIINEEKEIVCFDRSHKYIYNSLIPIKNSANEINGAIIVNQDITVRKTRELAMMGGNEILLAQEQSPDLKTYLERTVQSLKNLYGLDDMGVRILDRDGNITFVASTGFTEEFMAREEQSMVKDNCVCMRALKGKKDPAHYSFATPNGSVCIARATQTPLGADRKADMPFCRICGDHGYSAMAVVPVYHEKKLMGGIQIAGRTEGKITPELVNLVEIIARYVGEGINKFQMMEKVNTAQHELEAARRLSDIGTLAATMAHELRNPLAAIHMAAYNLRRKSNDKSLEKHLLNIDKKVAESDQIIKNLLFYSRLNAPDFQTVKLSEVLDESIELIKTRFQDRKFQIFRRYSPEDDFMVKGDPLLLGELFENVLVNGVDAIAEKEDGKIEISIASFEPDAIALQIRDNGVGIDPDILEKVFDPFFTTKSKGTGLGLSVCKQIIKDHQGEISMNSVKNSGTTVNIVLPAERILA